jgi:hypothetical protein
MMETAKPFSSKHPITQLYDGLDARGLSAVRSLTEEVVSGEKITRIWCDASHSSTHAGAAIVVVGSHVGAHPGGMHFTQVPLTEHDLSAYIDFDNTPKGITSTISEFAGVEMGVGIALILTLQELLAPMVGGKDHIPVGVLDIKSPFLVDYEVLGSNVSSLHRERDTIQRAIDSINGRAVKTKALHKQMTDTIAKQTALAIKRRREGYYSPRLDAVSFPTYNKEFFDLNYYQDASGRVVERESLRRVQGLTGCPRKYRPENTKKLRKYVDNLVDVWTLIQSIKQQVKRLPGVKGRKEMEAMTQRVADLSKICTACPRPEIRTFRELDGQVENMKAALHAEGHTNIVKRRVIIHTDCMTVYDSVNPLLDPSTGSPVGYIYGEQRKVEGINTERDAFLQQRGDGSATTKGVPAPRRPSPRPTHSALGVRIADLITVLQSHGVVVELEWFGSHGKLKDLLKITPSDNKSQELAMSKYFMQGFVDLLARQARFLPSDDE